MGATVCPICRKSFDLATSAAPPFCSPRCKLTDLGRWLDEENRLPHLRMDEEPPDPPSESDDDTDTARDAE